MHPLLIDEGLPGQVAQALAILGWPVEFVKDPNFTDLEEGGEDEENILWCREHGAVLVTNDLGSKDRRIRSLLVENRVHAIYVYKNLRVGPPGPLARALLCAEAEITRMAEGRHLISHRLTPSGSLTKR